MVVTTTSFVSIASYPEGQRLNPAHFVMTTNCAVRQFKNSIKPALLCKLPIATAIPFVILQGQITHVEHAVVTKNPRDFVQNAPWTLIRRDAGQSADIFVRAKQRSLKTGLQTPEFTKTITAISGPSGPRLL